MKTTCKFSLALILKKSCLCININARFRLKQRREGREGGRKEGEKKERRMYVYICIYVPFDKIFKIKNNVKSLRKYIQYNKSILRITNDQLFPFFNIVLIVFSLPGLFMYYSFTKPLNHLHILDKEIECSTDKTAHTA